jgi:hypothetical protein
MREISASASIGRDFSKQRDGRILHSQLETPKGPTDFGPFGFAHFRGCGGWI